MMRHRPKYVAEGFVEDSSKLMNDFFKLNSVEFKDFVSIWRKHNFSLVFMGRADPTEVSEFTSEAFRLTTQYFMEEPFLMHVGAVYMLYSLFQTQISSDTYHPVKIRLEMKHFNVIKSVRSEAIKEKINTLHHVIDYLIDHAFQYVAYQTLRGPLIAGIPSPYDVTINQRKEECLENSENYIKCSQLEKLRDLHNKYMEFKKQITDCADLTLITEDNIYQEAIEGLKNMRMNQPECEKNTNIGGARLKIKEEAFKKKAKKRLIVKFENLEDPVQGCCSKDGRVIKPEDKVKKVREPKRPRKEDKRPGRPRQKPKAQSIPLPEKNSSDDEIDITHLLTQQKALYAPQLFGKSRSSKTKRDPYYQTSPTRVESSSESDADMPKIM